MAITLKKVFGIVSYFPNNDTAYHIETRRERSRRFCELLFKLDELWPDIDIIVIAQNWQDFQLPEIRNTIIRYDYDKLGIVGARKTLRKKFLESKYDYLIMLDDDGMIQCEDPSIYINEIDNHPDGMGVIRHVDCPLMLLAISKDMYSKVDMPDIKAEQNEGFEDDLFVATCFAQYPDKCFDFPKDCVIETSFKYVGEGKCPSTWAKEANYDWNYMRSVTKVRIDALYKVTEESNDNYDVDAIIPFVDAGDKKWCADYTKYTGSYNVSPVRFRSWGTLRYLLRSIEKYMPFVTRVILLVARESQLPIWLNKTNVRVVYHKDFIPANNLPTFNSCTIESFLWNIPDLAEHIIYFNDDIFPNNKMTISDFFTNNKPHIKFLKYNKLDTGSIYRVQCRQGLDMIADALKLDRYPKNELVTPEHCITPMLKSTLQDVGNICKDKLNLSVSRLRQTNNVNQYIYCYYEYYKNNYVDSIPNFLYMETINDILSIRNAFFDNKIQVICLNDSDKLKDYVAKKKAILDMFEEKLTNKSKYED